LIEVVLGGKRVQRLPGAPLVVIQQELEIAVKQQPVEAPERTD
jgi:hypothetical protein